jgi:prepilin-type N-terminal cleavage/methylation domain-containing protein
MKRDVSRQPPASRGEAGFTLVEVLIAIVILVFGLVAVTNLLVVAGSSSMAANAGTAVAALASQEMENLKALPFSDPGMNNTGVPQGTIPAPGQSITAILPVPGYSQMNVQVPGAAGSVDVVWRITPVVGQLQLKHIELVAEARGPLMGARTQARFTTFRSCTGPIMNAGACPAGRAPCCPQAP